LLQVVVLTEMVFPVEGIKGSMEEGGEAQETGGV
jgi:hypothetical protein